jgi:hypothetical protein
MGIFLLYLDCWRLEKGLQRTRTKKAAPVAQVQKDAPAVTATAPEAPAKPRRTRKPVEQPTVRPILPPQSMGELLRAYGQVKEAIRC